MPEIKITGKSAYPGDPPSTYIMVQGNQNTLLTKAIAKIGNIFSNLLPDEGGKQEDSSDTGLLIKTSPTIWEYEMFRLEWDRRTIFRQMETMMKTDTRIKRANRIFAATAVRKGINITVSSSTGKKLGKRAQDIVDQILRDCQINAKLASWARILLEYGDLFLNPVVDIHTNQIKTIKSLPAISMQRNEDITGNFLDREKAFRQIDPIDLIIIQEFPLWSINHIRWDHQEGDMYGNSQYLQCRSYWKKLNMTEQDLVIRRRTRAVPRRVHILGTKDNPGSQTDIDNYKAANHLNANKSQITTDYYINGMGDVKDLSADTQVDKIDDVEHLQEVYMIGTGVPLHMLGFGKNVNRDIVGDQIKQFKEDTQELRDLIEYGDSSPYSGLRAIFDFGLSLQGIDPRLIEYNIRWAEEDDETPQDRIARVALGRSMQPKPTMSQKTAVAILAKDNGLENATAIEAELNEIENELEQDRLDQQTLQGEVNPQKPSTYPLDRQTVSKQVVTDAITDALDSKKKDYFPLHGHWATVEENKFKRTIKSHFAQMSIAMKKHFPAAKANVSDDAAPIINEYIKLYDDEYKKIRSKIRDDYFAFYKRIAKKAFKKVADEKAGYQPILDSDDDDDPFINDDTLQYFQNEALSRSTLIDNTTKKLLRQTLGEAYENGEKSVDWKARIDKIMGVEEPKGRAMMIARTELSWAYNTSLLSAYKSVGVERVRWLAVMDSRTCEKCAERHEQTYKLVDVEGKIPAHPRCRCTLIADE